MEPVTKLIKDLESEFGISPITVAGEANIDPSTLRRLLRNGSVRSNTVNRVRKAVKLLRQKAQQENAASY